MAKTTEQKTEKPTARKRRRAREEGEVAQSMEVNSAFVLMAGLGALALFGGYSFRCLLQHTTMRLGGLGAIELNADGALSATRTAFDVVLKALSPVMVIVSVMGLACSLAQVGILVVPKKLMPDLNAISPAQGIRNIFSMSALMRLVTASMKFAVIGTICFLLLRSRLHWLWAVPAKDAWGILDVGRRLSMLLMLQVVIAMVVVALLDYAYQRWRHEKELMMTKQELKEERKRDEGSPEVQARQERVRRAMARQRMAQAVPEADVVVTNPTRLAVALQWNGETMGAPTVVAKGRDLMARRIRQIAERNEVPIVERKPLTQALYRMVEVGAEIPPKLYYAVAEVLAFVLRERK